MRDWSETRYVKRERPIEHVELDKMREETRTMCR